MFVASTRTTQVSWLADRRLARLPGKQSGFQWLLWTRLLAHSCGDSCGLGIDRPHRIPFSPSCEEPSCASDRFRSPALSICAAVCGPVCVLFHVQRCETHPCSRRRPFGQEPPCRKPHCGLAAALDLCGNG